jgi:hypothetical protein
MPQDDDYATELRGDMRISNDSAGFSMFFKGLMGVVAVIFTTAVVWGASSISQLREDVAVLKDRPPPVTKDEFSVRMESVERRLTSLEAKQR